jgi:hypothetical protein
MGGDREAELRNVSDEIEILAEVNGYGDLHRTMRQQAEELQVSRETLDAVSGVQSGYSGKLLADPPIKILGWDLAPCFLPTLGLKLLIAKDPAALAKLSHRMPKKDMRWSRVKRRPTPSQRARALLKKMLSRNGRLGGQVANGLRSVEERKEIARRGARAANAKRSPEQWRAIGRKSARARMAALTPEQRTEIARVAARARWRRVEKQRPRTKVRVHPASPAARGRHSSPPARCWTRARKREPPGVMERGRA